jgi:predicted  nucleic acid-binding Zn-ribbon protein
MRFDLTPGSDCRVKVLNELPDFRIARLEGRNGIGKTMAVRLLQLCTGDQPYRAAEPAVWRELRKALGTVSIRCSELVGANNVEWEIDASLWPAEPEGSFDLIGSDEHPGICRTVTIDGRAADLASVRELLRVHRLAGDETLAQAIVADVSDLRTIAEAERSRSDLHRGQAGGVLEALRSLLEAASPATLEKAAKALTTAKEQLATLNEQVNDASKRHEQLKAFALRRTELSSLMEKHDDPEAYADRLEESLDTIREEQAALRTERDSLSLDAGRDEQTLKEIDTAESDLEAARREREKLLVEGHELAAKLGLLSLPASSKDPAFLAPLKSAEDLLAAVRETQANIDSGPQVAALGDRMLRLLADSTVSPIKSRPVATLPDGEQRRLSATDLEVGIRARQAEIEDEGRPPQSEQLGEEMRRLEEDLNSFSALGSIVRKVKIRDTKITRGRERLGNLTENLSGSQGERFAELEAQQQELAQQEADIDTERMRILQQMQQIAGGESTGTLLERLERNVVAAGTSLSNLEADISEQGRKVALLTQELEECELSVEQADAALTAAKAAQKDALTQMTVSKQWKALKERSLLPEQDLGADENQRRVEALQRACEKSEANMDVVSSLVQDQILAGIVAAEQRKTPDSEVARDVLRLLEERLGRTYFAHPNVAEALFEGGELRRFDLIEQIVEWQPEAEEAVSRHLEAFSSGERAFAYTKTRLERLRDQVPTKNRLVALDEFGAFLERSRLELLEDYLDHDVVDSFVDQALIVLPLATSRSEQKKPFVFRPYPS